MSQERWIYHITHIDNLAGIVSQGLLSDASRLSQNCSVHLVGMSAIKQRRLQEIEVDCCGNRKVGEFVPFYFCPRSVMLYVLHKGNHPDLNYLGGQEAMLHLACRVTTVVNWADRQKVAWAFCSQNAGAYLTRFSGAFLDLETLDWKAIASSDFRDAQVKANKQAEFLVADVVPWSLVEGIGVATRGQLSAVMEVLRGADHLPKVEVRPGWYF